MPRVFKKCRDTNQLLMTMHSIRVKVPSTRKPLSVKMDCSKEEAWHGWCAEDVHQCVMSSHISLSCTLTLLQKKNCNKIPKISLSWCPWMLIHQRQKEMADGEQTERANARYSGRNGRLVAQADSQHSSMRTGEHQTSPRCRILLIPKSLSLTQYPKFS